MGKLFHFISYHNAVPIAISFILLGAATTYAATNPDKIISKQDRVVSIDNTYIASKDLSRYTPSVKIISVTEDDTTYYVQYTFTTIDLKDSVWQDVTTTETMTVDKARLGNYRDLGLFVTEQLKEKIQNEVERLKETQQIEKKQVTQKTIVTKYKGLVGGFLDEKTTTIAGYSPLVKPQKPQKEAQTFARPDPAAVARMREHLDVPQVVEVQPEVPPQPQEQGTSTQQKQNTETTHATSSNDTSTTTNATSTDNNLGNATSTENTPANEPPTLALLGESTITLNVGDSYTDLGAVVTDDHDTDLSIAVSVNGAAVEHVSLDTSASTTYTITYSSTDSDGATATLSRTVIVQAPLPQASGSQGSEGSSTQSVSTTTAPDPVISIPTGGDSSASTSEATSS